MTGLLVVLVVTNCLTLTALVTMWLRTRRGSPGQSRGPGHRSDDEVFVAPRPAGVTTRSRRLITIEVLNPIELVGTRGGWVAGLAGSIAPGITRRVVHDQILKTLRRELADKQVLADVRLHDLRPARSAAPSVAVVDEVVAVELSDPVDPMPPERAARPARPPRPAEPPRGVAGIDPDQV